jgi:sugar-specific transcriptional regulator TrmB
MSLQDSLKEIGFSEKEAGLYSILAERGTASANAISKASGLSRSTVYFVLEALVQRRVVSASKKGNSTFFHLNPPDSLCAVFEESLSSTHEKLKRAQEISQEVRSIVKHPLKIPKVNFAEGRTGLKKLLYENEDKWFQSMRSTDGSWWGFDDKNLFALYETWFRHLWAKFEKERKDKIEVKVFTNVAVAKELGERFPKTILRPLLDSYEFESTVWVMGNYLVVIQTRDNSHYGFQIEDGTLAKNMRAIFRLLWSKV